MPGLVNRYYWLGFLAVIGLGVSWPLMGIAVEMMPPLWFGALRWSGAMVVVWGINLARGGIRRPDRGDRLGILNVALVQTVLVTGLVVTALRFVPSGRSAILVWTSSIWTIPLAVWLLREQITGAKIFGVVAGCLGVVLLIEPWGVELSEEAATGYGLLLVAAVAFAGSNIHIRAHSWKGSALEGMPWQLLIAAPTLLLWAYLVEGPLDVRMTPQVLIILSYHILVASVFGNWVIQTLGRSLPATTTAVMLMAVPAVGLASSIWVRGEQLTVAVIAGLMMIGLGVALSVREDRRSRVKEPIV